MGFRGKKVDTRVAKTAPAKDFEDESVKQAGENVRKRLGINSRVDANRFFTSIIGNTQASNKKQTSSSPIDCAVNLEVLVFKQFL